MDHNKNFVNKMSRRTISWFEIFIAFAIRLFFMQSSFKSAFLDRVEISTPLNSWKRLREGIFLYNSGVDPYSGDMFHETPIMLLTFKCLIHYVDDYLTYLFILIDLFAAFILFKTASEYVISLKKDDDLLMVGAPKQSSNIKISAIDVDETPLLVAYAYLYNPYIIFNCVAQTTTCISNLLHCAILYSLVSNHKYICVFLLSLATIQSSYPILLLVPVCLQVYLTEKSRGSVVKTVSSFVFFVSSLIFICYYSMGNFLFIKSIYCFAFNIHDLTPNIGLFWYFFTEMFEHFRSLFIAALQINATILYLVPLSLHLRKEPMFLSMILMALTAVFKSYPSLGDVGLYLSLLPLWNHLFLFMQQLFIVGCILIITSVLGPTVWHLWIYSGSANANFFFGVTLAFATAQIFLLTDLLFARQKRRFAIKYGWPEDMNKRVLILD